jgi:dTDP-4-amino-4,6-dideoxygalactose transaminase
MDQIVLTFSLMNTFDTLGTENAIQSYLNKALRAERTGGSDEFSLKCKEFLKERLVAPEVLLVTSCTHALAMAAQLIDVRAGDEILVPSFTFPSTVNAFMQRGAVPVFVDIREDTLLLNEQCLAANITKRTRAIVPVHYAGVGCEMDVIVNIANENRLHIIEDNAHGLFGSYRGKSLGTFGSLGVVSFHQTKNFSCGQGGALILNSPEFANRAYTLLDKGTNRERFIAGHIGQYSWEDLGSGCRLAELLSAVLWSQFEHRESILNALRDRWERYQKLLRDWCNKWGVRVGMIPPDRLSSYHIFFLVLPRAELRENFLKHLLNLGISANSHYFPLHLSPFYRRFNPKGCKLPVTETATSSLVRLPLNLNLSEDEQIRVVESIISYSF